MLKNPHWDGPSISSLIAWLETKDPSTTYNYFDMSGDCLLCRFLIEVHGATKENAFMRYGGLFTPQQRCDIAHGRTLDTDYNFTYGAALKRAYAQLTLVEC
jgi:hypothetical protein